MLNFVASESLVSACRRQSTHFAIQELAVMSVCDRESMVDAIFTVNIVSRNSSNKIIILQVWLDPLPRPWSRPLHHAS